MTGIDDQLAQLAGGGGVLLALAVAVLLGLRHATDPDHLTAVSTLVIGGERHGARRAARMGLAWGAGHATTLLLLGLPVVLLNRLLPGPVQRAAEAAVGVVIVALAVRLLWRWKRGCYHAHPHSHDGVTHVHPHVHVVARRPGAHEPHGAHDHEHADALGRTPAAAFGIGLVHGAGGSAGVGLLLVGAMPGRGLAAAALVLFAGATALSMAAVSAAWGGALATAPAARRLAALVPALGAVSLAFGLWYGGAAVLAS
jgi:ABC-type nickel/cobalt efflux system permease component RcnA